MNHLCTDTMNSDCGRQRHAYLHNQSSNIYHIILNSTEEEIQTLDTTQRLTVMKNSFLKTLPELDLSLMTMDTINQNGTEWMVVTAVDVRK